MTFELSILHNHTEHLKGLVLLYITFFYNKEGKSLKTPDNPTIISNKEENINIFNPRLKKTTFSSQVRYNFIYLINVIC